MLQKFGIKIKGDFRGFVTSVVLCLHGTVYFQSVYKCQRYGKKPDTVSPVHMVDICPHTTKNTPTKVVVPVLVCCIIQQFLDTTILIWPLLHGQFFYIKDFFSFSLR